MTRHYAFVSRWQVARSLDSLWDVLDDLLDTDDPMVWWPSVEVLRYDGETMTVRAASAFGYSLTFDLADLEAHRPDRLTFAATGDLRGRGVVGFHRSGPTHCEMVIDWRVAADRRWMRWTGWLLRPLFVLGHRLIMRQGEKNLNRWLLAQLPA